MAQQYRAQLTRQELIHSAAEVFHGAGYADASIAAISARAAVSNGGLHFHFRSKRALAEAVEAEAAQRLLSLTGPVPLRHPDPLGHLVETSEALARELLHDAVLRAGFSLADDASRHGGADLWEQWHDWTHLMLTVARDQGSLAPDADLAGAVAAITAVMAGHATLSRKQRWDPSASVVRGFWQLLLPRLTGEGERLPAADGPTPALWQAEECADGGRWELEDCCSVA
ncbi:ScbR family autoregulator-binding transcription factor [Streptomyces cyaneofuscatus]|uniref:ScbR family autoregulator-binding transcription factor n=1 Tax=Streptomyces cyaneofuscatus TaxID=66883 RepID=UPI00364786F9